MEKTLVSLYEQYSETRGKKFRDRAVVLDIDNLYPSDYYNDRFPMTPT